MGKKVVGITDDAVAEATGHGWDHWLSTLDGRGATELSHKEIVAELEEAGLGSAWWR